MRKPSNITTIALTAIAASFMGGLCWTLVGAPCGYFLRSQNVADWICAADCWFGPVILILLFFKLLTFLADLR